MANTTATLVYTVQRTGPISLAALSAKMTALNTELNLPNGAYASLAPFGANKTSSVVGGVDPFVNLTVVYTFTPAFVKNFPDGLGQKAPFRSLFTSAIKRALSCDLFTSEPVLA